VALNLVNQLTATQLNLEEFLKVVQDARQNDFEDKDEEEEEDHEESQKHKGKESRIHGRD